MARKGIVDGRLVLETGTAKSTFLTESASPPAQTMGIVGGQIVIDDQTSSVGIVGGSILVNEPLPAGDITVAVGTAAETDTAYAITTIADITVAVGFATETDNAQSVAPLQDVVVAVGQATETDSAFAATPVKTIYVAVGQATETDTAQSVAPLQAVVVAVGFATETDSAFAATPVKPIYVAVGQAAETDTANSATPTAPSNIFNIIDIDFDDTVYDGQNAVIHGTVFGSTQGQVFIGDESQTISNWTDTEITISVVRGGLSLGAQTLRVNRPA